MKEVKTMLRIGNLARKLLAKTGVAEFLHERNEDLGALVGIFYIIMASRRNNNQQSRRTKRRG